MAQFLNLTCRLLTGQEIKLSLPGDISISDVKELIAAECDLAPANQRLIFKGQQLSDDRTIDSYTVPSGSVIHVISNSSGGPSSTHQGSQGQAQGQTRNPLDFGDTMVSSMKRIMNGLLTPSGGDSTSAGSQGHPKWANTAESMKPLLMEGMKLAQKMSKGEGDLGQFASKLLSNMMDSHLGQAGTPETRIPRESPSPQPPAEAGDHADYSDCNDGLCEAGLCPTEHDARSAMLSAKDSINRVCDSLYNTSSSEHAHEAAYQTACCDRMSSSAGNSCIADCDTDLLVRTRTGIFLDDAANLNSKLPWRFWEQLESAISQARGTSPCVRDRADIGNFLERYADAVQTSNAITKELVDWSNSSCTISSKRLSSISMIFSLQAALQSELTLITSILSNQASQLETSVDGSKASDSGQRMSQSAQDPAANSSKATPSINSHHPEQDNAPNLNNVSRSDDSGLEGPTSVGGNTSSTFGNLPTKRESHPPLLFDMLSTFGRMAESVLNQPISQPRANVATSSQTDDDILLESTELRRLFNKYRDSLGFKSRMDEFVQKTKKLGANYCTGLCPK